MTLTFEGTLINSMTNISYCPLVEKKRKLFPTNYIYYHTFSAHFFYQYILFACTVQKQLIKKKCPEFCSELF